MGVPLITEKAKCAKCGQPMVMLLGMGSPGFFNIAETMAMYEAKILQGCFRCGKCGRVYCYDCSDGDKACLCGESSWQERQYMKPGFEKKLGIKAAAPIWGPSGTPFNFSSG